MMLEAKVRKPGYLYIYVSNENPTVAEVYFACIPELQRRYNDITMTHAKGNVIQYNACLPKLQHRQEYYAYGLQTGNWCLSTVALAKVGTRANTTGNNFLGNGGTELNTTSQLYDLDYRNYDPILGRMNQVDPLASKYASITPYNFSFNNPVTFTDPSGAVPANADYRYYREESMQRKASYNISAFFTNNFNWLYRGGNPQSMFNPGWTPGSESLADSFYKQLGFEIWEHGTDYIDPNDGSVEYHHEYYFLKPIDPSQQQQQTQGSWSDPVITRIGNHWFGDILDIHVESVYKDYKSLTIVNHNVMLVEHSINGKVTNRQNFGIAIAILIDGSEVWDSGNAKFSSSFIEYTEEIYKLRSNIFYPQLVREKYLDFISEPNQKKQNRNDAAAPHY